MFSAWAALALAAIGAPTPFMGVTFCFGVPFQIGAIVSAVSTLAMDPPAPPRGKKLAAAAVALVALPWILRYAQLASA